MKLNKLAKLATVSALALGAAYQVGVTPALAYEMGTTQVVVVNATVDNTITLTANPAATGAIGVTGDAVDTATMVLAPNDAITEDIAGAAHLVSDTGLGTAAKITVTAAFPTQNLYVSYSNPVNLNCGLCAPGTPDLALVDVLDDMTIPGNISGPAQGIEATDNVGALAWNIGVTISTIASPNLYLTGAYAGSFDMIVTY